MKKKRIICIFLVCLAVGSSGAATYAYLTDRESTVNTVRIAGNEIHIEEDFDPPEDPSPGDVIPKKPTIVNDSEIPVYVRMDIRFTDGRGMEQCEPLSINPGWELAGDGYYYYEEAVPAGGRTGSLFDQVTIKSSVPKETLVPFDILVYAESVQAHGFETAQAAFASLQKGGSV